MSLDPHQMTEQEWLLAPSLVEETESDLVLYRMLKHLNAEGKKDSVRMQSLEKRVKALGDAFLWVLNRLRDCCIDERKMRLFGCAYCQSIREALVDERCRRGVEVAELRADGLATDGELRDASQEVALAMGLEGKEYGPWKSAYHGPKAVSQILGYLPTYNDFALGADQATIAQYYGHLQRRGVDIGREVPDDEIDWDEEYSIRRQEGWRQVAMLLDIFGNPFRAVTFAPGWKTPAVVKLAGKIYADRLFDQMPALGEALVAAGCVDEGILAHCSAGEAHVRGCWVVDLVLGLHPAATAS